MFSMFSAVSGHFTKGLVLGTLLPVLLFAAAAVPLALYFLGGLSDAGVGLTALLSDQTTVVSVSIVALTGLLYNLNTPVIRLYEGYPWSRTPVGRARAERHRRRLARASALQRDLIAMRARIGDAAVKAQVQHGLNDVSRVIASEYPGEDLVLPTRLGNIIRNAEEYPRAQYGMSAIPLWPRLVASLDKEYAGVLDEAKTWFDFFLNSSLLATILASLTPLLAIGSGAALRDARVAVASGVIAIAAALLAYAAYVAAVGAAAAWGAQIKGAFDLYRNDLLKQLGYHYTIDTREEERRIWRAVSRQIIFGDPLDGTPLPYTAPATAPPPNRWERIAEFIWPGR